MLHAFTPSHQHALSLTQTLSRSFFVLQSFPVFETLSLCLYVLLVLPFAYIQYKRNVGLTYTLFLYVSCRPAPVVPSERKRKWCHATTTALRGTTGDPGSGEISVRLASTMEEPIIAVPLPLSMATTVRGSFPFQLSPPCSPPRSQLPWQRRAATLLSSEASRQQDQWLLHQPR